MTCRRSYVIRLCAQKDEEIKRLTATMRQLQQALELEKSDVRQLRSLCASLESDLVSSLDYATAAQVMLFWMRRCCMSTDCDCRPFGSVYRGRCLSSSSNSSSRSSSSIGRDAATLSLLFQGRQHLAAAAATRRTHRPM